MPDQYVIYHRAPTHSIPNQLQRNISTRISLLRHHRPISPKAILTVFFVLIGISVLCHQSGIDEWIAKKFYIMEGGNGHYFPWRDNFWLNDVLHEEGRALVKRLFLLTLGLFLLSWPIHQLARYRPALLYVVVSTLISTALISFLKHHTTIPCPQSLEEFGGSRHWINIWQLFESDLPHGSCYPAGHASGGYAWLCLVFLFPFRSRAFYIALLPGVLLGLTFGITQQLRGEHFASHDIATIAICWLVSGAIFHLARRIKDILNNSSLNYSEYEN